MSAKSIYIIALIVTSFCVGAHGDGTKDVQNRIVALLTLFSQRQDEIQSRLQSANENKRIESSSEITSEIREAIKQRFILPEESESLAYFALVCWSIYEAGDGERVGEDIYDRATWQAIGLLMEHKTTETDAALQLLQAKLDFKGGHSSAFGELLRAKGFTVIERYSDK